MKSLILFIAVFCFASAHAEFAADSTKTKKKGFVETMKDVPDMLIATPDAGPDSMANVLRNDNLYIKVNPMWKDKGINIGNDLKVAKINEQPLNETFPLQEKNLTNGMVLTLLTQKKTAEEKKQAILTQVKTHLTALYKEAAKPKSAGEINTEALTMIGSPQPFTTNEGKTGELYIFNDISVEQSALVFFLIMPGTKAGTTCTVQWTFYHYNYETEYPADINEMRLFQFDDDKATYIDFTKNLLKTLQVR